MAKFRFRMATLVRLREAARDERQLALAEAHRADDLLREHQEGVSRDLAELKAACREAASPGPLDVDRLLEAQRYELMLRASGAKLGQQREMVAAEIQRRREALVRANRDVRVLEKLREHQADRHRRDELRREINQLDEAALLRAAGEPES